MSWTLTTSGACVVKAGNNVNDSIALSGAVLAKWSDDAEATLSVRTKYDWVGNYSKIGANYKNILSDTTSSMVAMNMVSYDMSGYTSKREAETILDVLRDGIVTNIEILKEAANKDNMGAV